MAMSQGTARSIDHKVPELAGSAMIINKTWMAHVDSAASPA
jgi:hypothetical protein